MPRRDSKRSQPGRDLAEYRRQTDRQLLVGFILIVLLLGGGLIFWYYGWGGLIGGLSCMLAALGLLGLLWLLLSWAGRWAEGE